MAKRSKDSQGGGINFVFCAQSNVTTTKPGQDILNCTWLTTEEIMALSDSDVLRPRKLRTMIADMQAGRSHPNDLIRNVEQEEWENTRGEQAAAADARALA